MIKNVTVRIGCLSAWVALVRCLAGLLLLGASLSLLPAYGAEKIVLTTGVLAPYTTPEREGFSTA